MSKLRRPAKTFSLDISLQPKQREFLDLALHSPCGWVACGGAKAGGKSAALRRVLLTLLFSFPGSRALLIRKTWDMVYRNAVLKLWDDFPQLEAMFNKTDKILTLPNDSQLQFGFGENDGDVRRFNGVEYDWIAVDQSEEFSLDDLRILKSCNRSRIPGIRPKLMLTFNPGGPGHMYNKRIFLDRTFQGNEAPEEYAPLLVMHGWDNIVWVRDDLERAGLTADDYYYRFTEAERRKWFLDSPYGKDLLGLDDDLRAKYLDGDWDVHAGQYFHSFKAQGYPDGNLFGPHYHEVPMKPWYPRWISMDGGFKHGTAVYWWFWDGTKTYCEQEWVVRELEADAVARGIFERSQGKVFADFVLSHDWFLQTVSPVSRAAQMRIVFDELNRKSEDEHRLDGKPLTKVPAPRAAPKDRANRNSLLSQKLGNRTLLIHEDCTGLIRKLPLALRDSERDSDFKGFEGDDEIDGAGYGITVIPSQLRIPKEVEYEKRITATEPNARAMQVLQLQDELRRQRATQHFSFRHGTARRYA